MRTVAKFLLAVLSVAPVSVVAAPVSQTAGNNLTKYNGSLGSMMGNQWNRDTNPRANMKQPEAKADYDNCQAVILRCAKPKCAGGGCVDANVAQSIVSGCISSNDACKKIADELVGPLTGQLVSASTAEQNKQAVAAAQNSAENQQMQQQMQQMQQQMQQMQQQNSQQIASLQNQLEESQQATADAVAAAAKSAADNVIQNSSTVVDAGTGLTAVQSAAAKSGVSEEVIARATISGQILTDMEGVDSALEQLKTTMRDVFRYGKCNETNGDSCEGPKRVKKFRELAQKFFAPYDALEDNLELALDKAENVGVDLGNIYMFFSGSCKRWAEYICRGDMHETLPVYSCGSTAYATTSASPQIIVVDNAGKMPTLSQIQQTMPDDMSASKRSVQEAREKASKDLEDAVKKAFGTEDGAFLRKLSFVSEAVADGVVYKGTCNCATGKSNTISGLTRGGHDCADGQVIPPEDLVACTVHKHLDSNADDDKILDTQINPEINANGSIRVGCESNLARNLIGRRRSSGKGKGGVDIDLLQYMIGQSEGAFKLKDGVGYCACASNKDSGKFCSGNPLCMCGLGVSSASDIDVAIGLLESATRSKSLPAKSCCDTPGNCKLDCYDPNEEDVAYVNPLYALCDTHAWNAGFRDNYLDADDNASKYAENKAKMQQIIGLKTTVITQQMYKQYVTLEKIIRQLKILLEREVLKSNLKVASGTSDNSSSSSSGNKLQFTNCEFENSEVDALKCVRSNYAQMQPFVAKGTLRNDIIKQIVADCIVLNDNIAAFGEDDSFNGYYVCKDENNVKNAGKKALEPIQTGMHRLQKLINDEKKEERRYNQRR